MRTARFNVVSIIAACLSAMPSAAATITLTDANSVVRIDPSSQAGFYSWVVDGMDVLQQQWFWYRIGNTPERSIDTLTLTAAAVLGGAECSVCALDLVYSGDGFTIEIFSSLRGGEAGSGTADIARQIRINNRRNTSLDFHFFEYTNYNLDRTGAGDEVVVDPTYGAVDQIPASAGSLMSQTILTDTPTHGEGGLYSGTMSRLNDNRATVLSNGFMAGEGDGTWAFQWDKIIARRGTYLISEDDLLLPLVVPEPGALVLLTSAVIGGLWFRRRLF